MRSIGVRYRQDRRRPRTVELQFQHGDHILLGKHHRAQSGRLYHPQGVSHRLWCWIVSADRKSSREEVIDQQKSHSVVGMGYLYNHFASIHDRWLGLDLRSSTAKHCPNIIATGPSGWISSFLLLFCCDHLRFEDNQTNPSDVTNHSSRNLASAQTRKWQRGALLFAIHSSHLRCG